MHLALNIFILLAFIVIGWILFVVWLIGILISGIVRGARRAFGMNTTQRGEFTSRRCPRLRCRTDNPGGANYCRRCGARMVRNIVLDPAMPDRSKSWVPMK
jgi:hypothetical protein